MGEQINRNNDELIKEVGGRTTGENTTRGSSTDTTAKSGGNRGNRSGGSGGSGGKTTTEKEVVSSVVDVEEQKRLERNAKRRERYAKQKAEGTLKPKKVNTKKKSKEVIETNQIETLIKTVSVMISSRKGQEHWILLDSEVKAIAEPLANILKDSNAFNSISEHSNAVALVIACITIILPRTIKSITDINTKKKKKREVMKNVELRTSKRKNINNDTGNNRNTSANDKNDGSNAIWYGDAISL